MPSITFVHEHTVECSVGVYDSSSNICYSSSSGFSANFNKLKAQALELGVHGQRCAQFDQDKISVGADGYVT